MTADHLPRIVSLGERAVAVYGYSGRGIAPGTVFGTAVGDYVLGADPSALPLPPTTFGREPLAGLKRLWFEAGATAFHLVSSRLPARRAPR
jgi:glycine/D-amino acid oxidase-like deaminating enzyme